MDFFINRKIFHANFKKLFMEHSDAKPLSREKIFWIFLESTDRMSKR
jgi:hypothetical protein